MVVTRGKYRGLKLSSLENYDTRPTAAKVKEAIFSMLDNQTIDAKVLDLFAGSGALGIEALSNGAAWIDFVDNNKQAIKVINKNCSKLKVDNYTIIFGDYQKVLTDLKRQGKQYNLIFLDPPYRLMIINELLKTIITNNIIEKNGIIICECSNEEQVLLEYLNFEQEKNKKYGKTKITIFRGR